MEDADLTERGFFFFWCSCLFGCFWKKMPRLAFFQELRIWISCFCVFIVIIA